MFGDFDDFDHASQKEKKVKVYVNGNPLQNAIQVKIVQPMRLKDFARQLEDKYPGYFKTLRIFNQEGVELFEDDLEYAKNGSTLFASAGEDFDSKSTFSEYEMVKELGEGGFGKVLLGVHRTTKEKVAIKIVKTSLIGNAQDIDMVFREAEIMKSLEHKNIVKIKNCFTLSDMQVVFIMEYLEGGELLAKVEEKGIFEEEEAKSYFKQIVDAMAYCHRNKLIHRDLKLENILLANKESNDIKIIDFGIAGCVANKNTDNLDAGSLRYMAPEVLQGNIKKLTSAVDVWAMGVILFSMVIGELPFAADTNAQIKDLIIKGVIQIPSKISKKLSPECKDVLNQMLDVDPATRISTVELMNHPWICEKSSIIKHFEESKEEQPQQEEQEPEPNQANIKIQLKKSSSKNYSNSPASNSKNSPASNKSSATTMTSPKFSPFKASVGSKTPNMPSSQFAQTNSGVKKVTPTQSSVNSPSVKTTGEIRSNVQFTASKNSLMKMATQKK